MLFTARGQPNNTLVIVIIRILEPLWPFDAGSKPLEVALCKRPPEHPINIMLLFPRIVAGPIACTHPYILVDVAEDCDPSIDENQPNHNEEDHTQGDGVWATGMEHIVDLNVSMRCHGDAHSGNGQV